MPDTPHGSSAAARSLSHGMRFGRGLFRLAEIALSKRSRWIDKSGGNSADLAIRCEQACKPIKVNLNNRFQYSSALGIPPPHLTERHCRWARAPSNSVPRIHAEQRPHAWKQPQITAQA